MSLNQHPSPTPELRMPAEWEPHAATWLAWPHYRDDWPGKFEPIPWVYAEIIRQLARHEPIELIVNDRVSEKRARRILDRAHAQSDKVRFHRWPTNRVWTRDSGCTFAAREEPPDLTLHRPGKGAIPGAEDRQERQSQPSALSSQADTDACGSNRSAESARPSSAGLAAIEWRFNAWAKYPNWQHDRQISRLMAQAARAVEFRPKLKKRHVVLEGGSIDVNGRGSLLTTEECLLSTIQQRNPPFKRRDYEKLFAEYLGCRNVIWLNSGIAGDDTHGHIDDIARFVAPDAVIIAVESDPNDPNYEPLRENVRRLREAGDQDGKPLSIVELPMPAPIFFDGRRLPASYANFYIANGVVLVPVFNDPNDRFALDILADLFPDREVVGIYAGDLIWGLGTLHCMTQQQPRVGGDPSSD
ncbi:MAG TPA: agmatine deiminase family protein [Terriglobales bacterium]|nr:agmatine deiminase family protein [Terriglobales bacterium]